MKSLSLLLIAFVISLTTLSCNTETDDDGQPISMQPEIVYDTISYEANSLDYTNENNLTINSIWYNNDLVMPWSDTESTTLTNKDPFILNQPEFNFEYTQDQKIHVEMMENTNSVGRSFTITFLSPSSYEIQIYQKGIGE
ncbi:hypothetical protein [Neptunitalea lumnitzerae]|uniref:Uncharacterized protein n=1 Tax=Neptunitalea lumnitzerae TaxID=2965509 RepID=A0ABQ5MEI6_9FLAO|nr:hypothetical protein [Neptunitalea sp. Y10]GLB47805.1 hypothetical protein Y10_01730 [Neptunitalea sp. Y10]